MNDFTKDELADLRDAVFISGKPIELYDKIQYLIDTFSEMKLPTMADYCCRKCNEEWHNCECKK